MLSKTALGLKLGKKNRANGKLFDTKAELARPATSLSPSTSPSGPCGTWWEWLCSLQGPKRQWRPVPPLLPLYHRAGILPGHNREASVPGLTLIQSNGFLLCILSLCHCFFRQPGCPSAVGTPTQSRKLQDSVQGRL